MLDEDDNGNYSDELKLIWFEGLNSDLKFDLLIIGIQFGFGIFEKILKKMNFGRIS